MKIARRTQKKYSPLVWVLITFLFSPAIYGEEKIYADEKMAIRAPDLICTDRKLSRLNKFLSLTTEKIRKDFDKKKRLKIPSTGTVQALWLEEDSKNIIGWNGKNICIAHLGGLHYSEQNYMAYTSVDCSGWVSSDLEYFNLEHKSHMGNSITEGYELNRETLILTDVDRGKIDLRRYNHDKEYRCLLLEEDEGSRFVAKLKLIDQLKRQLEADERIQKQREIDKRKKNRKI